MLRNNGDYKIYVIEFQYGKYLWGRISFDVEWVKPEHYQEEVWDVFSAGGKCWQETGIHGTFDLGMAIKLYCTLSEHRKDYKFRVVLLTISQKTKVIRGSNVLSYQ